ncbi:MAG: lipid-A-disaccharide synthase [Gammaproteobacteria bacterium]|nr:MAG: lipid-A-disaccharide synthase [Gammaproteobacteria bacterium]
MPKNKKIYKIMVSAGEASGDSHGTFLLKNLKLPYQAFGMGGVNLKKVGMKIIVDNKKMAVMGIVEVLKHYPFLKKQLKKLQQTLIEKKPDLLILIDYPDFNLRLAKTAKRHNIKVLYYISPQIWAWRQGRVKKIAKLADHMAVIFPFEVEFYKKHNIPVSYVGHPLIEKIKNFQPSKKSIIKNSAKNSKIITLLPGSRNSEFNKNLPTMITTTKILQKKYNNLQVIIAIASTIDKKYFENLPNNIIKTTKTYDAIIQSDIVLCASGTATLEVGLLHKPFVIIYKINKVSYLIIKSLLKIPFIGLINLVAGHKIIPEFIQNEATAENITPAIQKILNNKKYRDKMITDLKKTHQKMIDKNQTIDISQLTTKILKNDEHKT